MLSWIYPDPETELGKAAVQERIRAVHYNYPAVIQELRPTARQLRNAVKDYNLQKAPGQSVSELPVLSVRGPLINDAVEKFSNKLFCALYYKHAGRILPSTGGIAIRWWSNIQIENDEIPTSILPAIPDIPTLQRANTTLNDQFFYRWGVADTKAIAAFLAFFRRSFAVLGYVRCDASKFGLPEDARILRPYNWA